MLHVNHYTESVLVLRLAHKISKPRRFRSQENLQKNTLTLPLLSAFMFQNLSSIPGTRHGKTDVPSSHDNDFFSSPAQYLPGESYRLRKTSYYSCTLPQLRSDRLRFPRPINYHAIRLEIDFKAPTVGTSGIYISRAMIYHGLHMAFCSRSFFGIRTMRVKRSRARECPRCCFRAERFARPFSLYTRMRVVYTHVKNVRARNSSGRCCKSPQWLGTCFSRLLALGSAVVDRS